MSNKSGVSEQVISLPSGGGALCGLGETFSPDLHTGTGNFTVPIVLPPGRNGLQPDLKLVYSTGNGNGPFGLGWSLSIPGVSRKTSKGIPRYDDARDVFLLSGAEDLVAVARPADQTWYRPRTEGLFARIIHHHSAGDNYWEVRARDGLTSYYGTPGSDAADPAAVADPANRAHVFAWNISQTIDLFGNRIDYHYSRDAGQAGPRHWDQLYLEHIRYADYRDATTGETRFLVSVTFDYGAPAAERPDPFSDYRAGFERRTRQRCRRMLIRTHARETILTRSYEFIYLDERVAAGELPAALLPLNGVSLLSQIRVVGYDGAQTETMPPLEFGYSVFEPAKRDFFPLAGQQLPDHSLASPDLEMVDLFGNGLPDILQMNGIVRYWRNQGDGRFDLPRQMSQAPAGLQLADPGVQLIDADGDGRIDLLVTTPTLAGYFPLTSDGGWDRRSFRRYRQAPSFDLEGPEVKLLDLNGDGVTDALCSSSRLECFFNDSLAGWNDVRRVERRAIDTFPSVTFSDPHVKLADMTGDGMQDIVLVYDGCLQYWPNLGYGNWGGRVTMRHSPRFPFEYNPKRILLGDVDGDGLADLIYVEDTRITLWINQSGNAWSEPLVIIGTPLVSDMDAVRLLDLLGNGIGGVLWSADARATSQPGMFFLDFTGGVKPYLLNEMNNHMGAITRVQYTPSTHFYLADQQRPETRWQTQLPFPVQVVAQVEVIDQISQGKQTTSYRYHHGYWDGAEREFRGFGLVEQIDSETFEAYHRPGVSGASYSGVPAMHFSPPVLTKTWFHQGPVGEEFGEWSEFDARADYWPGDPPALPRPQGLGATLQAMPRRVRRDALRALRSRVLRTELYALDGTERQARPYTVTETLYGLREESQPGAGDAERQRIFFPHLLSQRTTLWERGNDPMTRFTFSDEYDAYGLPRSQIMVAVPRGREYRVAGAAGEPYLVTQSLTNYAHRDDAEHYLIGRVVSATGYEILNDGSLSVPALHVSILNGSARQRLIDQTLNFYDGPALEGLPLGQLGVYGLLSRTERLALTEEVLYEVCRSGDILQQPPEMPPYLAPGSGPAWKDEYPQEFRELVPALAGYHYRSGGADAKQTTGYFVATERRSYDCQASATGLGRGLLIATRDPLGHDTTVTYDAYDLFATQVSGPTGLTTHARYDYQVMQPVEVTDPNGNRTAYDFSPLGLLERTAVLGKVGEQAGDTLEAPGTRLLYDFLAFAERGQPASVRTIRRVYHLTDTSVPLPQRDETIETVEYSDGFGRLLQTRTQAEAVRYGDSAFGEAGLPADQAAPLGDAVGHHRGPGELPRVVVSGWQRYDNKGRVVQKYEPFFSTGFDYAPPAEDAIGQNITVFYDPRGQIIHTVNPDHSEQRVVFGIPVDLANPEHFVPTPWEAYTYDANDNAERTHGRGDSSHWNTPTNLIIDAMGRTITRTVRNGPDSQTDWFRTRSTYDIRGNLLSITDSIGRVALRQVYDFVDRPWRMEHTDTGVRRVVLDAIGNAVESRDSKGALTLHAFDQLNRPIRVWARDATGTALRLRERLSYGDSPDAGLAEAEARAANQLGRLYRHYDEAGRLTLVAYDFKGNILEKTRQVIADGPILEVFAPAPSNDWQVQAFGVDWRPPGGVTLEQYANRLLDQRPYQTSVTYDALNRPRTIHYPRDAEGERKELRPHYNQAGALERVELHGVPFVSHIAHNAKGQRTLIAYGNGVMTRYAYDLHTSRLARLRSERYITPTPTTYRPTGTPLQDLAYSYDLVGNLTVIHDRSPGSGVPNTLLGTEALDRVFTYDPLYRLLSATGRETDRPGDELPWADLPRSVDMTRARVYTERYTYDSEGNLLHLQHQANAGSFTRALSLVAGTDRLAALTSGSTTYHYTYDPNGNLTGETTSRHFEWDHADRVKVFRTQTDQAEPSLHAHYLYDAAGQRAKKLVRKQGGRVEVTVYIDGLFEHHRRVQGQTNQENNTLHVIDDHRRIALVRVGAPFADDTTPAVEFHMGDHLGGSTVVVDNRGAIVSREEYTPYGETSFGSFARKRYRFTGKERDEESGLYYHGARYYAPWLARWISCDPAGTVDGLNLYSYVRNNPLRFIDPYGEQATYAQLAQRITDLNSTVTGATDDLATDIQTINKYVIENADDDVKTRAAMAEAEDTLNNADFQIRRYGKVADDIGAEIMQSSGNLTGSQIDDLKKSLANTRRTIGEMKEAVAGYRRWFSPPGGGGGSGGSPRGGSGNTPSGQTPSPNTPTGGGARGSGSGSGGTAASAGGGKGTGASRTGSKASTVSAPKGSKLAKALPVAGIALGVWATGQELQQGNYGRAALEAVAIVVEPVDWVLLGYDVLTYVNDPNKGPSTSPQPPSHYQEAGWNDYTMLAPLGTGGGGGGLSHSALMW